MASAAKKPKPPKRFWQLVKHGDTLGRFWGDEYRLICSIVGMATYYGVPLRTLEQLLTNPANAAASAVRTEGNPDGRVSLAEVRRQYARNASEAFDPFKLEEHHAKLLRLRDIATSSAWPNRLPYRAKKDAKVVQLAGRDLRRVYAAHLQAALASDGIDYPASSRYIVETSGVGKVTAQRCTDALESLHILRRADSPGRSGAFTAAYYRMEREGVKLAKLLDTENAIDELTDLAALELHPAWNRGPGITFASWAAIVALDGHATCASIAADTGQLVATVRVHVRNMIELGLVERLDDHTIRALTVDHRAALDAVALQTGNADRARRVRERHEHDRALLTQWVLTRPAKLAEALRRGVRSVVAALKHRAVANRATGEVIAVALDRRSPPYVGGNRQHAPPTIATAS